MLGTLTNEEINLLLKNQTVGRIGCHFAGETYIVPISYAYDGAYIYCHSYEGKKIEMMRKNNNICFEVDELQSMANWKSVIIKGLFEELVQKNEKRVAMETLLNRHLPVLSSVTTHLGNIWPFHPDDTEEIEGIVFRIRILEKTGRFEITPESPSITG
jgi:uncharacterized protein